MGARPYKQDAYLNVARVTIRYRWGHQRLTFHTCRTCGCTSHWENLDPTNSHMAVNGLLSEPDAIEGVAIRHFDGADTWSYLD